MPSCEPALPPAPAVVLDTNAVLDWLVFADPRIAALATAISARQVRWIASASMREEFCNVLARPRLHGRQPSREHTLSRFDSLVDLCVPPVTTPPRLRCTDSDDQVFLDLAVAERAGWLITRDKALLALRGRARLHGLAIGAPEHWAAR